MTLQGWILIIGFVAVLLALTKPVGLWLHALYEGRRTPPPRAGPRRARLLQACRHRPRRRAGL